MQKRAFVDIAILGIVLKFRYEANIFVGAVSGGMVIGGDKQIDEGIPVGPGGPFRMEFRAEIE